MPWAEVVKEGSLETASSEVEGESEKRGSNGRWYSGLNVCISLNPYVEILTCSVMVLGGGASGGD